MWFNKISSFCHLECLASRFYNPHRQWSSCSAWTNRALPLSLWNISLFTETESNHLPPWQPNPSWCCAEQRRSPRYGTPWGIRPGCFTAVPSSLDSTFVSKWTWLQIIKLAFSHRRYKLPCFIYDPSFWIAWPCPNCEQNQFHVSKVNFSPD